VIRVGIVGCNYGRTVQLPAFRADLDAAQRSHRQGVAIKVAPAAAGEERRR
jgi:hypothetical protein